MGYTVLIDITYKSIYIYIYTINYLLDIENVKDYIRLLEERDRQFCSFGHVLIRRRY